MVAKKSKRKSRRGGGTVMYGFAPGPAGMAGYQSVTNGTSGTGGRRRKRGGGDTPVGLPAIAGGGSGVTVDVDHPVAPGHAAIVGYGGRRRGTRRTKK